MVDFRIDIQSLRVLPLFLVFCYNYNKDILPTGFIGVDTLLDKSKMLFYFNRLKRLFPVCHLTLFV